MTRAVETRSGPPDLVLTRVFDAPRSLVFDAWTRAEILSRWFAPSGFTMPACELDFRAGGRLFFILRGPDGEDYPFEGVYRQVAPPSLIVFAGDIHDGNHVETTVTFAEHNGKTTIVVKQSFSVDGPSTRGAPIGWGQTLDHLAALVKRPELA